MNQKIIFVDDEENILKSLKRDMIMADVDAEYFTSATAALDYLSQYPTNIVVSDIEMPGMDGIEFLKEVQKLYPDIYRVVLSGLGIADLKSKQALEDRIIEQCFSKPWDADELLAYFQRFER